MNTTSKRTTDGRQINAASENPLYQDKAPAITSTYKDEESHKQGKGGPRPLNPRTGGCPRNVNPPVTKAEILRKLEALRRRVNMTVDWSCHTSELARDDLILDLYSLLWRVVSEIPDDDEVVIRWKPQDLQESAAEMGIRLSRKQAKDLLRHIGRDLEDKCLGAGQDLINECLEDHDQAHSV